MVAVRVILKKSSTGLGHNPAQIQVRSSNILCLFVTANFFSLVFEITLLTSDKQNAGTNQNASIVLIGEKRKSQVYKIENSVKNKLLRRGHTDTFKFVTKPLGPLREVIVGHRPKPGQKKTEKEQSWYLHEVVVKNTDNGER